MDVGNYYSIASPPHEMFLSREIVKRNHERVRWNLKKFFHGFLVCLAFIVDGGGGDLHSGSLVCVFYVRVYKWERNAQNDF